MKTKILAIATAVLLFAGAAQAKDVTIAVTGPFSGPVANFGEQIKNGANQAVKDINAAGGVLGQPLKIKFFDDACDPKQSVTVANQIVAEGIPFVAGPFCSGSAIPASRIYAEEGVLMITQGATNPQLTAQGYKNVFRMVGTDDMQGSSIAKYVLASYAGKNIALVHDKQTYSKGLVDSVSKGLESGKANIVMRENVNPGEKDYTSLVTRLKEKNVDVLVYGGYQNEAGLITRQMREQGLKTVMIGGDALSSMDFWAITGKAGEGTLFTSPPDVTKSPDNQKLLQEFKAAKISPDGYTIYTYADIKMWADIVNKIGSAQPSKVIAELRSGEHDTALGKLAYDDKGDIKNASFAVYEFSKGKIQQINNGK